MALLSNEDNEVRASAGRGLGNLAAGICLHLEKAQEKDTPQEQDKEHVQEEDEQEQQKQTQEIQEIKEQA
jgi:hypothetical protein